MIDYKSKRGINVFVCMFMLDPCTFTTNKQEGIQNECPKSTRDGNFMSVFSLKSLETAGFGASLVLSFTWELALITNFRKVDAQGMKNSTDAEYHNICNIYRIYNLNIRDYRY